MFEEFSRTELLIGKNAMEKLKKSKVLVFGAGGVGGYALEALIRAGVGNVGIIDNDIVTLSNINRQIIALHSTIGQNKVDVTEKRLLDINPNAKITKYKLFYNENTKMEFDFSKYDYVIDAIDTVSSKLILIEECKKTKTPIISSMGTGNKLNPDMFFIADIYKTSVCPLARIMRYELKKRNVKKLKVLYSKEKPIKLNKDNKTIASISFCPSTAGLLIASEVVRDLIKDV